jgi:modification methylase
VIYFNMKTTHEILFGDSRDMGALHDNSVHLIATSPPYWQLKDYGNENQIGFDDTYEQYINNLNLVWQECFRVLHPGCRLCINIGDQFARSVYYGRYKIIPIRTEIIKFCETIGFDYMGAIIWQKVTTCNTTGGASIMGSFPYPRNGIIKLDYEFILIFKKLGNAAIVSKEIKDKSKMTTEEWNMYFNGHWNFAGEKQNGHLAMFPEELPKRLIKMFTFVGDTVLDPFLGSGTTMLAARNLLRSSIGFEVNSDYESMIRQKLGLESNKLFDDYVFNLQRLPNSPLNFAEKINQLPYIFRDPIKFNKKIDVKSLKFGSKIDSNSEYKNEFYTVKEILSTNLLMLNTGLKIKMYGIRPIPEKEVDLLNFLVRKLKGKQIFLKFDDTKYDDDNNLLGYIYLKNKTFINAYLVKYGFAVVDDSAKSLNISLMKLRKDNHVKGMDPQFSR